MADFRPDIDPINVRPSMGTYNNPQTFRFWCQKVLPLVYDDSLSYYELLCKVVDYLNLTMEDVNTAVQDVTNLNNAFGSLENHVNASEAALLQAYTDLQNYVNNYFDSLDFQQAVSDKLDEMASDGTLDALLLPHFNTYVATTDAQIQEITDNMEQFVLNYVAEARGQISDATEDMQDTLNTAIGAQNTRIGVVENEFNQLIALQTAGTMQGAKITTFVANNAVEYTLTTGSQSFSFVDYAGHITTTPAMSTLDGLVNPILVAFGAYVLDANTDSPSAKPLYVDLTNEVRFYPTGGYLGSAADKRALRIDVPVHLNDVVGNLTGKYLLFTFSTLSTVPTDLSEITDARVGADGVTSDTLGGAIRSQVTDLKKTEATIGNEIFSDTELTSVQTSEGWKLNDDGYRIADANYQILRFRVFAGDIVKVVSDHKWQFQTSTTVTASGTLYRVEWTRGTGTYYMKVPETVTYVVLTTTITGSTAHVYKCASNIDDILTDINALETHDSEATQENNAIFASLFNSYTSQVSDIPYPNNAANVRIGIDTSIPAFASGGGYAVCVPVINGTSVRVTKPQSPVCLICFTSEYPTAGTAITHYSVMTGLVNTEFVAESQAGDNYLVIYASATEITATDCTFAYSQTARGTVNLLPQLDTHMINLLKYRPVGKVSKAYIALSCDDGHNSLATYTIPRIQYWNTYYNTNIPLHMALFDNSPVFASTEYTALITDMCENHNCSIGIHGTQPYELYSSSTALYAYLKKQWDTIIDKTGITPTSVIYPHSSYNDQIMVMTAGFCGICGASGSDAPPYTYSDDQGLAFYVGEKSNCYEIYRLSIKDTRIGNATQAQRIIDYAIAHNLIICPYFHDDDFTEYSAETNAFNKAMLDAFIQYGMEQNVEFINFGDIPKLL